MTRAQARTATQRPDRRLFNSVRACSRGLAILEAINTLRYAELRDIVQATRLPRTTVIRLIETLEDEKYVLRDPVTGAYEPAPRVTKLSAGLNTEGWLVTVTTPILRRLLSAVGWPSDVMVLQGDKMVLRNSNRSFSPLQINRHHAGMNTPLVGSSSGRAYLAWCGKRERDKLIAMTTKVADRRALLQELERTRERGYAVRDPDEKLGAIAIPVLAAREVVCCLTCVFIPQATRPQEVAARSLEAMRAAAEEIAQAFANPLQR